MSAGLRVFLSYHSADRDRVLKVYRFLTEHGVTTFLDQQDLRAGQSWPRALQEALSDCGAVAVFVGARLGNWQRTEIGFALNRQAEESSFPVIPVLLDGADTRRSFLFLNTWIDLRGPRLDDPAALSRLLEAVSDCGPVPSTSRFDINPYRGLEFFDEEHAPFFFGRETEVEDLFERVTQRRSRFVAVIGASGSGKSSVVRAGVIPRLRRRQPPNETWDIAVFTPGERPWLRLADTLAALRFPHKSDTELDVEVEKLARALQADELRIASVADRLLRHEGNPSHRLLVVADQFEELFTLTPPQDRAPFLAQLLECLSVEGFVLVLTLRADLYGQAMESSRRLGQLCAENQIPLGPLMPEELRKVIAEPARLAGLTLDAGLTDLLLHDAGNEPGNLPLLQHALFELCERGKVSGRLTIEEYESISGIRGAIANSAEREYVRLEGRGQGSVMRRLFTQLVHLAQTDEGHEDTRRRIPLSALAAEEQEVAEELAGREFRLLVSSSERIAVAGPTRGEAEGSGGHQSVIEVAHEALIRKWSRLKGWLNEDRGFYLWRQRLDQAERDYNRHGRHADYLLKGVVLKEAESRLAAPTPEPLSIQQQQFIRASVAERDVLELEAQRRALRTRRIAVAGAVFMLVIALFAVMQSVRVDRQRRIAVAEVLSSNATSLKPIRAAQLAALALQIQSTVQAREVATFLLALQPFRPRPLSGHTDSVNSVAFSRDGSLIVSGSWDKTLRLWDGHSGARIGVPFRGHEGQVFTVDFSPDGTRIASGGGDNTVRLWGVRTGKEICAPLLGHSGGVNSVVFSPDGTRVVSGDGDGKLRLWDARNGKLMVAAVEAHAGGVGGVTFSPDGSFIVSGGKDKTVRLWDARSLQPIATPIDGHKGAISSVAINTDGSRIVSGGEDGLRLWDVTNRGQIGEVLPAGRVRSVTFTPDGLRLVSGGTDGTIRLWDARNGHPIGGPLWAGDGEILSVAFSPDSRHMVSGGLDLVVRLWEPFPDTRIATPLRGHDGSILGVTFSPDGNSVLTASADKTLRLWDVHTGEPIGTPLRGHTDWVRSAAFSPDGSRIVSGSTDNTLRLWNAHSGQPIGQPFNGHRRGVASVAFSPDGTRIVSGGEDNMVQRWDVATGRPIGEPMRGHEDIVSGVAFSSDGRRIVSGSWDDTVRLWDAVTGKPIGNPLRGHSDWVFSVAFSPDGHRIVSGGKDRGIRLWDADTGRPIGEPMLGHEVTVLSVAFSPDGKRVISGSADHTVRVWDLTGAHPVGQVLRGNESWVLSVAFSPDGRWIASGGMDNVLRLWDAKAIESGPLLQKALCGSLDRNLTRSQWSQYVPEGESYRTVCANLPEEK